jgi:hypothetical protein
MFGVFQAGTLNLEPLNLGSSFLGALCKFGGYRPWRSLFKNEWHGEIMPQ